MRLLDILYAIPGNPAGRCHYCGVWSQYGQSHSGAESGSLPNLCPYDEPVSSMYPLLNLWKLRVLCMLNSTHYFQTHYSSTPCAPVIVSSPHFTIGGAVIATSSLSYLGLGVEPHIPEWGNISEARAVHTWRPTLSGDLSRAGYHSAGSFV